MSDSRKILKTEVAFSTPWCELVSKQVQGEGAPFYSLRLRDYVSVLPITREGSILVVRQYRPAVESYTLEVPSGILDPGLSPEETARKELLEETGCQADEILSLGPAVLPDTGRLGNRLWCFVAKNVKPLSESGYSVEEGIEVLLWTPEDLKRAVGNGDFSHGLHLAVILLAQLSGYLKL